jgi:hypothetical protein
VKGKQKEVFIVPGKSKTVLVPALWLALVPVSRAKADLVVNGNFEQGNSGFTTNYVYSPGNVAAPRSYDVVTNPTLNAAPGIAEVSSYGDHTSGSGLMMVVHGAQIPNVLVWAEIVAVQPNSKYDFSAYISSWSAAAPGGVDVSFNGTSLGMLNAPSATGVWVPFTATWNSGSATSAIIQLRSLTTAPVGNDFALDDITLKGPDPFAVPEPAGALYVLTSSLTLGLGDLVRRFRRRLGLA